MKTSKTSTFWLVISLSAGTALALALTSFAVQTPGSGGTGSSLQGFNQPRTADDQLPAAALGLHFPRRPEFVSEGLYEGTWNIGESRRLVTEQATSVFGVPTDKGHACYVVVMASNAAGGCVADFTEKLPFGITVYDPDEVDRGAAPVVVGLVPNEATAVHVAVGHALHRAHLTRNAYLYELESPREYPSAVIVRFKDGSSDREAIPDGRPTMRKLGT